MLNAYHLRVRRPLYAILRVSDVDVLQALLTVCAEHVPVKGKPRIDFTDAESFLRGQILSVFILLHEKIRSPRPSTLAIRRKKPRDLSFHPLIAPRVRKLKEKKKKVNHTRSKSSSFVCRGIRSGNRASASAHHLSTISVMARTSAVCTSVTCRWCSRVTSTGRGRHVDCESLYQVLAGHNRRRALCRACQSARSRASSGPSGVEEATGS